MDRAYSVIPSGDLELAKNAENWITALIAVPLIHGEAFLVENEPADTPRP